MAEYKWEAGKGKLTLKDGDTKIAEISGLPESLVGKTTDTEIIKTYTTDQLKAANYIEFKEHTMNQEGTALATNGAGTITIKDQALTKGASSAYTITLTPETNYANYYKLALDGATSLAGGSYVLGGDTIAEKWTTSTVAKDGGDQLTTVTAKYYNTGTKEKWTLAANGLSIAYAEQVNGASLATITGLKGGITAESLNADNSTLISRTRAGGNSYIFTLSKDALNGTTAKSDGNVIQLTDDNNADNIDFSLALGTGIAVFDSASSTSNPRIGSVSAGTAIIERDQSAGWKTIVAGQSFSYGTASVKELATISGLSTAIVKGWNDATKDQFGIRGDNNTFTEALTITGTTVTLNKNALTTGTISIADSSTIGNDPFKSFSLALNSSDTTYNSTNKTLGFEDVASKWVLTGTSAAYKSTGKTEGWTLSGTSVVTYSVATTITDLATITNLSANVRENGGKIGTYTVANNGSSTFNEGITVTGTDTAKTVTLAKAVLTTTAASAMTLTDNLSDDINFSLELKQNDGIVAPETLPSSFALSESSTFSTDQKIEIVGTREAGWTLSGTSVTYTGVINEALATITNLSSAVTSTTTTNGVMKFGTGSGTAFVEGITFNPTTKDVTINKAALTTNAAASTTLTLTTAGSGYHDKDSNIDFNFKLGNDVDAPGTTPIDIKLGKLAGASDAVKSLNVIGTMTEGWTLDTADGATKNKQISYTARDENRILANITNLNKDVEGRTINTGSETKPVLVTRFGTYATPGDSSTAFTEGIKLNGTTITLNKAVLNALEDVKLANGSISTNNSTTIMQAAGNSFGNDYVYKFSLASDVVAPATENDSGIKNIRLGNLSSATGGKSIDIIGTLSAGWTLDGYSGADNNKVTYTAEKTPVLATISGLSTNLVAGSGSNAGKFGVDLSTAFKEALSLTDKTVTLYSIALKAGGVSLTPNSDTNVVGRFNTDYSLALGNDVVLDGQKILTGSGNIKVSSVADGTATIQAKKDAFWTLADAKTVNYTSADSSIFVDVATVTGLNKNITTAGSSFFIPAAAGGTSTAVNLSVAKNANGNIEFKLTQGSLSDSNITITPTLTTTKENFTLAFAKDTDTGALTKYNIGYNFGAASGTVGFEPIYYWDKTSATTTAYLKADRAEGWTLGTDSMKVTYTKEAKTGQIVATITNLQKNLAAKGLETADWNAKGSIRNKIAGISLSDTTASSDNYRFSTITLDKDVLTTTVSAPTTLTLGKELGSASAANYKFVLQNTGGGSVPTAAKITESGFTQLGTTTTYSKLNKTAYWTINSDKNTVTYAAQETGDVLFTLKGLNSNVTEDDINLSQFTDGIIMLKAKALNNSNVTLTNGTGKNYTLTLFHSDAFADADDSVPFSTLSNAKWSLNSTGTTATYKADVAKGYEISLDGKTAIYTAAATNKTIVTVNNLKGGLAVSSDGSYIGVKDENDIISQGLTLADNATAEEKAVGIHKNKTTLTQDVLGTTNVSITGTGIGANYLLDIDTTTAGHSVPTTTTKTVSGVTYEAKSAGGSAPAVEDVWRVSGTTNTTATYKNVVPLYYTVNDDGRGVTYHAEETKETYATVTGLKKGLTVKSDNSAVVFTNEDGTETEVVKIKESTTNNLVIQVGKDALAAATVKVTNGGTDKYTFELMTGTQAPDAPKRDDSAALTFSQDSTTKTTGLLKGTLTAGYTVSDDKASVIYSTKNTNHTFATITGLKEGLASTDFNGTNAGISIDTSDPTKKTIKLDLKMLGTTDVNITSTNASDGYMLSIGTDVLDSTDAAEAANLKNIWAVNDSANTTYIYKTIERASYTPTTDKKKLTYKAESNKNTLATITNLKSGLKISDDRSTLAGVEIGTTDNDGKFTKNDTDNTKAIQLSKDVLVSDASKPVSISGTGNYKLTITDDAKTTDKDPYWTVSGTTATRKYDTTAGFVVATGTTVGTTGTTVTYQAAKSGNTATTVATITGLKSGLKVKSDGSIDGITFGDMVTKDSKQVFEEGAGDKKVIQLSEDVLDAKEVSLTVPTGTGFTQYKLALENYDNLTPKKDQYAFAVGTDGTVTLNQNYTTAGYTGANGTATKFTYSTGTGGNTTVAKITGLKSGLKVVDGAIDGIMIGAIEETGDYDDDGNKIKKFKENTDQSNANTIIRLSAGVLNGKDVEITKTSGTNTYTLAIKTEKDSDTDTDLVAEPEYTKAWKVPSKGKVTFTETTTAGYALDTKTEGATSATKILYSPLKTVTTTISGLNDSIKLIELDATNQDGLNPNGTKVKVAGIDKNNYIKFTSAEAAAAAQDGDAETEVEKNYGTFTLGDKVLKKANVTLTNDNTYGAYTLELASGVAAENYNNDPVWFKDKNSDTATYSVRTKPGYTLADDGLKVNYSTKDTYTDYAKIKGLNKDIEAENGAIDGIEFDPTVTQTEHTSKNAAGQNVTTYTYTQKILLGYNALTNTNVTVEGETKDNVTYNSTNTNQTAEYILGFKSDDTNPNADADNKITGKEWYEAQYAAPTWTFNKNKGTATLISGTTDSWAIKTTTTGTGTSATPTVDNKTIVYTAGTSETLATISGLKVVTQDGVNDVEGLNLDTWNRKTTTSGSTTTETGEGAIHLTLASLNKKDVTVTSTDDKRYEFTFELEADIAEPEQKANVWTADGKGNATYQYTVTEGYTLDADKKTSIAYSPEVTTTLAKLTGLATTGNNAIKKTTEGEATLNGIEVTALHTDESKDSSGKTIAATKGTITLTDKGILGKTVKITGDKYELDLSEDVATQLAGKQWYLSGTTATYKEYYTTGYNLNAAKTTATNATTQAAGDTVLTVKGLKKNLKLAAINEGGIVVNDDDTVAIKDTVLGTTKVTLVNGTYKDAANNDKETSYTYRFAESGFTTPEAQTPTWQFSSGTANLRQTTTKGFTLGSSDSSKDLGDVLTYSAQKTESLAKVKNLNTKLKAFEDVIGTYKTVSGKTVIDTPVITYDTENKLITLNEAAFNKKTVSFASNPGGYKLAFGTMGSTNTAEDQVTEWVVSGTTGSFKQYKPLYYSINEAQDTITYTKEDSPKTSIFAQVTNLKKGTTLTTKLTGDDSIENPNFTPDTGSKDAGDIGGVLTLYKDNLNNKSVALSGNQGYSLELGSDITGTLKSAVTASTSATANNSGKAVITGTRSSGYEMAFGSKAITWISKNKTNQAVATVTGLKKNVNISASDGVITLDGSKVNKKTITLTTNLGTTDYKLAVSEDATLKVPTVTLRPEEKGGYWNNVKSSAVSVIGAVTEDGYILSASEKSLTYIKETAKYTKTTEGVDPHKMVAIATIKGVKGTDSSLVDAYSRTISLHGNNLGSKVTVNGGAFSVNIDKNFNDASLVGSSAADNISVAGSGLTVMGGAGDDYIDLGSGGNNTFVYANGAGNDVIAGFTPGDDKLKITKGTITVEHDGADAIVKVGTGKIRLKGAYTALDTGKKLTIYNNKDVATEYFIPATPTMTNYSAESSSNVLLEDSNYSADAANLSNIVEPDEATYTPYDFDTNSFSLTKEDKLTSAAVTYSGDSKKK